MVYGRCTVVLPLVFLNCLCFLFSTFLMSLMPDSGFAHLLLQRPQSLQDSTVWGMQAISSVCKQYFLCMYRNLWTLNGMFSSKRWISWCCRAGHKTCISFQGAWKLQFCSLSLKVWGLQLLHPRFPGGSAISGLIPGYLARTCKKPKEECQKSRALARVLWVQALLYFLLGILPSGPINGHGLKDSGFEDSDFSFSSYSNCCTVDSDIVWECLRSLWEGLNFDASNKNRDAMRKVSWKSVLNKFRAQGLAKLGSTGGSVYWLVSLPRCGLGELHFPHEITVRLQELWSSLACHALYQIVILLESGLWLGNSGLAIWNTVPALFGFVPWFVVLMILQTKSMKREELSFLWMSWMLFWFKGSSIASWFSSTGGRNLQQPASSCERIWAWSLKYAFHYITVISESTSVLIGLTMTSTLEEGARCLHSCGSKAEHSSQLPRVTVRVSGKVIGSPALSNLKRPHWKQCKKDAYRKGTRKMHPEEARPTETCRNAKEAQNQLRKNGKDI